jgi:arginase family enzyme
MAHEVSIIGAPSSAGAYAPGQEKAPDALRRHGLIAALEASGMRVHDWGNVPSFRWRPDLQRPKAMNADAAARTAHAVADLVDRRSISPEKFWCWAATARWSSARSPARKGDKEGSASSTSISMSI